MPRRRNKITMNLLLSLVVGANILFGAGCGGSAATRPAAPAAEIGDKLTIPVVELRGDGAALGSEHGKQMRQNIRSLHQEYFGKWFKNEFQHRAALWTAGGFQKHLDPQHRAEIAALAKSIELPEGEVLLGNCFLDLISITACSTVTLPADAAPDGVARFGRNLDFPGFDVADKHSVLLIVHPKGRYSFASISWPGLVGVLSGMNEHGLAIANMEVRRSRSLPRAMPHPLLHSCPRQS